MPNKIFSIKLNSFINPKSIKEQADKKTKNNKKATEKSSFAGLISKPLSNALSAYAAPSVVRQTEKYKNVSAILDMQNVKDEAKQIYSDPKYRKLYAEAKKDAQNVKEGKYDLLQAENKVFKTTEPKGSRPAYTIIIQHDLKTGKVISKSVVSENDARPTIITKYDGDNFEEVGFLSGHLYKYSQGRETENGWVINSEYRYSLVDLGKVLESNQNIVHYNDGSSIMGASYMFDDKGECTYIEQDIELDCNGKKTVRGNRYKHETDGKLHIFKVNPEDN